MLSIVNCIVISQLQDVLSLEEETLGPFLESLGISDIIGDDIAGQCVLVKNEFEALKDNHNLSMNMDVGLCMDDEAWEEAKDIFFMLRVPFELDASEESREKFSKALLKRNRKRGRYGPQGGVYIN